ncbi:MAG: argininosuccinate synthase [Methanomassiliicoccus sp.]|nr:argininosuccinate synthase [Methanomassiliicoccus sp.]
MVTKKKDSVPRSGRKKVVLAYSGGLDTSVAIRWLQDNYDLDVVAVSIDVGQPGDMEKNIDRAKGIGAIAAYALDAREEFAEEYVWPSLKANAMYQGAYPLSTAIARPLIAKLLVDVAKKEGADYIAHGCTAKGNDQVRFDVSIAALAPNLGIIAPMREWVMTREEEIDYAKKNDIPIPVKKSCPYSTDENLWGRSCECGVIEDASKEPPEDAHEWTVSPLKAPNKPTYVDIAFDKGVPVSVDGRRLPPVELIMKLNKLAGENGVGRIDHVEDRLVGIKSRETYECPAAVTLIKAHQAMESMVLTRDVLSYKRGVEQRFSELAYDGLWFSPLREALDAFVESTQKYVTGMVRVKLYKGNVEVVGRESPYSLYDEGLATYAAGDEFDHTSAKGFIYVWGLPLRTVAAAHKAKMKVVDQEPAKAAPKKAPRKKAT